MFYIIRCVIFWGLTTVNAHSRQIAEDIGAQLLPIYFEKKGTTSQVGISDSDNQIQLCVEFIQSRFTEGEDLIFNDKEFKFLWEDSKRIAAERRAKLGRKYCRL